MPIILIIKIKTANLIIRKRGENNLYHFSFITISFYIPIYSKPKKKFTKNIKSNRDNFDQLDLFSFLICILYI